MRRPARPPATKQTPSRIYMADRPKKNQLCPSTESSSRASHLWASFPCGEQKRRTSENEAGEISNYLRRRARRMANMSLSPINRWRSYSSSWLRDCNVAQADWWQETHFKKAFRYYLDAAGECIENILANDEQNRKRPPRRISIHVAGSWLMQ